MVAGPPWRARHDCACALDNHQRPDDAKQGDVRNSDREIELAQHPQQGDRKHTARGSNQRADEEHRSQREIERLAPPICEHAGERGGGDVGRDSGDRDRWRDADEDQNGCEQKPATDTEHADRKPIAMPIAKMRKILTGKSAIGR